MHPVKRTTMSDTRQDPVFAPVSSAVFEPYPHLLAWKIGAMLQSYETLSCPVLLPGNPLADIGGTMQEYDAFGLTAAEKAHHLDIHERHLVQV
jgi:hypothetical protein